MSEDVVMAESFLADDGAFQDGWLGNLPEDTFERDDTGVFKQGDLGDHKSIASIVKSYLNKDKMLGKAIQPLPEKPTPEQIAAYNIKMGCPEKAEGYETHKPDLPEGMAFDDNLMASCAKYAHDNHIPKGVFEGLAKMVVDGQIETFKKVSDANAKFMQEESDKSIAAAESALKAKHGAEYPAVLDMANRFYELPGNAEVNKAFTDLLKERGMDSNPAVIDFFHECYKLVKGDVVPGVVGVSGGNPVPAGQLDYSVIVGNSAQNKDR